MKCCVCGEDLGGRAACITSQLCVECAYGPPIPLNTNYTLEYYIYYRPDLTYIRVVEDFPTYNAAHQRYKELMDPVSSVIWARQRGITCRDSNGWRVLLPVPERF
jgi:hypothetical protein